MDLETGLAAYYAAMRLGEIQAAEEHAANTKPGWWEKAKSFVQEKIVQPVTRALDENIYKPYIQPFITTKQITATLLVAVLGVQGLQWVNNVVINPQIFLPAQTHAELLIEELRSQHPPAPENHTLSYLINHPYDVLATGADVLNTLTSIGASYGDAIWQQNPIVETSIEFASNWEEKLCSGISNQAWANRCTTSFYLTSSVIANPADTIQGVGIAFVVDPIMGFFKQEALGLENVLAIPDLISAVQQDGLPGASEFITGLFNKNLSILMNDRQVQSALFLAVLILLALVAAPVAGGIVLGMTAKGLMDIDATVTTAKDKKSLIEFITSHAVRVTVVSSALILAMMAVGLGQKASEFRAYQESLTPAAQTTFAKLSLLEQTRLADLAIKLKLSPSALEFYLTESARPGSSLAELPVTDALRVSALVDVYSEATMSTILLLCEKYGINPYDVLTRPIAEGQSPTGWVLGIDNPKNPVNHPLVKLHLTEAEVQNILAKSIQNPNSKVVVLGYGGGAAKPYYILGDEINGTYLSLSPEEWAPFENARANFWMDINTPMIEAAIENRKIFLFNVEYKLILDPANVERFSLPELRLIELKENNYVRVPVGEYTAFVPIELLGTYEQYLPASLFRSGE